MAQGTKLFTLEDLIPGGGTYRQTVPETAYTEWWGDKCIRLDIEECRIVDNKTGDSKTLFTLSQVNDAIGKTTFHHLYNVSFPLAGQTIALLSQNGKYWHFDWLQKRIVWSVDIDPEAAIKEFNTISLSTAYTKDYNLFVQKADGSVSQISTDGSREMQYGLSVHRDEFGIHNGLFWSPKGRYLAFYRMDQSMVTAFPQVDMTTRCATVVPDKYPMAGEASHKVTVGIYDTKGKKTIYLDAGDPTDRYFTNIAWSPDESTVYMIELNRDQNHAQLVAYDAATGKRTGVLVEEKNSKYEDITLVINAGKAWKDDSKLMPLLSQVKKVNSTLPTLKRLNRVLVTGEMLPTANGIKIKRAALKKLIAEGELSYREMDLASAKIADAPVQEEKAAAAAPTGEGAAQLKEKVRKIYAETLDMPVSEIGDNAHFIDDLHGDSLQVLGMSLKLEETMGILIPVEEYGNCTTVNDLTALLLKKQSGTEEKEENDGPVTPITRFEDSPEYIAFQKRQEDLLGSGMENPYFVCHDSPLLDTSNMAGQRVLNFGSYNYVGMSGRPEVKEAAKQAIDLYGTSASGSRLLAGEKTLHQELEKEIADWKHTETALVLVGGHSTNVTCVGNFCGKGDLILYDAIAHNSVAQGCQLSLATCRPFPHNDYEALEGILRTQRHKYAKVLIIIEGAYSMDGDIAPVPKFVEIKKKYGCFLMVDEAHSACVIGKTGGGVDEYFGLDGKDIDIKMGTLSKGLGTCGGYLAGSKAIIEYMRYNLPGFVFSVGLSPALAAASLCAIRLLRSDPSIMQRMERNIKCFVNEAHKRNLNTCLAGETAIVPIMVGSDEDAFLLSNMLRYKGVFVPPAVYPAVPKGKARLRFCVISEHQPEQIVEALDALLVCAKEAGIDLPSMDA